MKKKEILTIPPPRHRRKIQKFSRFRSNHILQQLMHMNFGIPYNLLFILLLLLPNILPIPNIPLIFSHFLCPCSSSPSHRPSRPRMIKTPNRQRRKKQHPWMMEGIDNNSISPSFFSFSFSFRRRRKRRKRRKIRFIKNKSCMPSSLSSFERGFVGPFFYYALGTGVVWSGYGTAWEYTLVEEMDING